MSDCVFINDILERIKSFEWEIDLLKRLQHPNIVKYFGMERTND